MAYLANMPHTCAKQSKKQGHPILLRQTLIDAGEYIPYDGAHERHHCNHDDCKTAAQDNYHDKDNQPDRKTGFLGFDFMIEDATGDAYLIECNPRPIQVCHLGSRIGADLCGALAARLRQAAPPSQTAIRAEEIALFPQEWQRDAGSLADTDRYLDVPWEDQPLLRAMVA